jgi:hypothetical protein
MSTVTKIGPEDHGLPMSFEEYLAGDYQQGYHYELIDGRLYVSPEATYPKIAWKHGCFQRFMCSPGSTRRSSIT